MLRIYTRCSILCFSSKGNPASTTPLRNPFFTPKKAVVCTGFTLCSDSSHQLSAPPGPRVSRPYLGGEVPGADHADISLVTEHPDRGGSQGEKPSLGRPGSPPPWPFLRPGDIPVSHEAARLPSPGKRTRQDEGKASAAEPPAEHHRLPLAGGREGCIRAPGVPSPSAPIGLPMPDDPDVGSSLIQRIPLLRMEEFYGAGHARYFIFEGNVIVLPATMNAPRPR